MAGRFMGCLSLAHPLRIRSSTQPTGLRFATALSALCAPALRFTLAVWHEDCTSSEWLMNDKHLFLFVFVQQVVAQIAYLRINDK